MQCGAVTSLTTNNIVTIIVNIINNNINGLTVLTTGSIAIVIINQTIINIANIAALKNPLRLALRRMGINPSEEAILAGTNSTGELCDSLRNQTP